MPLLAKLEKGKPVTPLSDYFTARPKTAMAAAALWLACLVAAVYWPVLHAEFVWDDLIDFQQMAWLRLGNDWQHLIFRGFNDWNQYFRPLGVALFTMQVHLTNDSPGGMHLVSLVLHLVNTILVGSLAVTLIKDKCSLARRLIAFELAGLLFGLHPLLVESVTWIGVQFDLLATFFILIGLLADRWITHMWLRAVTVSGCFFLALCAKESGIVLLPVLVIFEWMQGHRTNTESLPQCLRRMVIERWPSWLAMLLACVLYLIARHEALGSLVPFANIDTLPFLPRMQQVAFLYTRYWTIFFWPSPYMGPLNPVDETAFLHFSAASAAHLLFCLVMLSSACVLTLRRKPLGALILCVSLALSPVLHILAARFDNDLYHARYAMTALSLACAWLPAWVLNTHWFHNGMGRMYQATGTIMLTAWLVVSILLIRATIPLWSTQLALFTWSLQEHPNSVYAKGQLISGFTFLRRYDEANALINDLLASNQACADCMLNGADIAVTQNNVARADMLLAKAREQGVQNSPTSWRKYLNSVGKIELLEGNPSAAINVANISKSLSKYDSTPWVIEADALAYQGRYAEAYQAYDHAVALMMPYEKAVQQQRFEQLVRYIKAHPINPQEQAAKP